MVALLSDGKVPGNKNKASVISGFNGSDYIYNCIHWLRVMTTSLLWIILIFNSCFLDGANGMDPDDTFQEFKMEIQPMWEECFHQYVVNDAQFFTAIEVLRGQDQKVDFFVKRGDMVLHKETGITKGEFNLENATEGTYSVCIDNVYSRFGSKLVYVYLTTFHPAKWDAYIKEVDDMHDVAGNLTESLSVVQASMMDMLKEQAKSRFHMVYDMYRARGNNYYVQAWSICQCTVIVLCSIVQVYLVRRLFRTTNVTPTTSKPRA